MKSHINCKNISFKFSIILILLIIGNPIKADAAKVTDFIPQESLVYIQLRDIDEIYNEIQISEKWKLAFDLLFDDTELEGIQQELKLIQGITRIKPTKLFDMIGYQSGLAFWKLGEDSVQGGLVIHSGGNLSELQRITKVFTGFIGISNEGILKLDAGKYRNVKYNTLLLPDAFLTYGFVSDCLVVGIGENSFEKIIDTYKKKNPSIRKNKSYLTALKEYGEGQLSTFANVRSVLPSINDLTDLGRQQLKTFNTVFARLNVLDVAPIIQVYSEFNPNHPDSRITPFLKEGTELESLKNVIGDEDLFIAIAPTFLDSVWQFLQIELEENADDQTYAFISFLEGRLNLNLKEDIMKGLTGEIALSVDNLMRFDPNALESLNIELENSFHIDASNVTTEGALIFIPSNQQKWYKIGNSFSNLQNTSVSQSDYKGAEISEFASNIYFAERDNISILSFSENQMYTIVDRLQEKRKLSYLKQLPKTPLAIVKLNIMTLLKTIDKGVQIEDAIIRSDEVAPILAWVTVKENEVVVAASLSEKESPLEIFSKFAPIIASNFKK